LLPVSTAQPPSGRLGKYPLLGVIGKGSMGVVYKSVDPYIKRPVALKTIRCDRLEEDASENFTARFRHEAQAAGSLAHPSIVAVYEYGEADAYAYIAMEYVEGRSLRECFEQRVAFSVAQIVDMLSQLLEALQYAHERGVWHRDIKPGNILLMANGRVKVTDFGIARIESSMLTQDGAIMGTPGFIAPEMYLTDSFDSRIDLFAAGVLLYQLLAGAPPFTGSAEKVMFKVCYETPAPPSVIGHLPAVQPLDAVVMKALARDPGERFATAAEFLEALRRAYAQLSAPGRSDETIIRPRVAAGGSWRPSSRGQPSQPPSGSQPPWGSQPPSGSHAPSSDALKAAGWDTQELARIEKRLAHFMGPVAKVMVRRAACSTNDILSMTLWLAQKITGPDDREQFLRSAGVGTMPPSAKPLRPWSEDETLPGRARSAPAARPLTPEDVAQAAKLLTLSMGPISTVLAKRAATLNCSREQFVATLAAYLTDDAERERFLKALG
jgi:serine/threonine-protein kinase